MKRIAIIAVIALLSLPLQARSIRYFTGPQAARTVAYLDQQNELMIYCGYEYEIPTYVLVNEVWMERVNSAYYEIWLFGYDAYTGDEVYMPLDLQCVWLLGAGARMYNAAKYLRFHASVRTPSFAWYIPPYNPYSRHPHVMGYSRSYHYSIHCHGWMPPKPPAHGWGHHTQPPLPPYYMRTPSEPIPAPTTTWTPGIERPNVSTKGREGNSLRSNTSTDNRNSGTARTGSSSTTTRSSGTTTTTRSTGTTPTRSNTGTTTRGGGNDNGTTTRGSSNDNGTTTRGTGTTTGTTTRSSGNDNGTTTRGTGTTTGTTTRGTGTSTGTTTRGNNVSTGTTTRGNNVSTGTTTRGNNVSTGNTTRGNNVSTGNTTRGNNVSTGNTTRGNNVSTGNTTRSSRAAASTNTTSQRGSSTRTSSTTRKSSRQ